MKAIHLFPLVPFLLALGCGSGSKSTNASASTEERILFCFQVFRSGLELGGDQKPYEDAFEMCNAFTKESQALKQFHPVKDPDGKYSNPNYPSPKCWEDFESHARKIVNCSAQDGLKALESSALMFIQTSFICGHGPATPMEEAKVDEWKKILRERAGIKDRSEELNAERKKRDQAEAAALEAEMKRFEEEAKAAKRPPVYSKTEAQTREKIQKQLEAEKAEFERQKSK